MKALRTIALVAVALAGLAPASAWVLDSHFGRTVQPVTPSSPEAVKLNKMLYEPGGSVAEIYGVPTNRKMRVLFVKKSKILRPSEDPSLALLMLDKQAGDNPLQTKTVWFVAWRGLGMLLLLAALAFGGSILLGRRRRRKARLSAPPRAASARG